MAYGIGRENGIEILHPGFGDIYYQNHLCVETYIARIDYGHLLAHVVGSADQRCVSSQIP